MGNDFESCQKYVAEAEGGANFTVVNGKPVLKPRSRADRGGPTKYGITWGTLGKADSQGITDHNDITQLTREEARAIYQAFYWAASKADKMRWGLCLVHYDCAVNSGVGGAAKQLQRALRNLGAGVTIDGAVGPKTMGAIAEHPTEAVAQEYLRVREAFYRGLVSRDPKQGNFLQGWMNRLEKIRRGLGL